MVYPAADVSLFYPHQASNRGALVALAGDVVAVQTLRVLCPVSSIATVSDVPVRTQSMNLSVIALAQPF